MVCDRSCNCFETSSRFCRRAVAGSSTAVAVGDAAGADGCDGKSPAPGAVGAAAAGGETGVGGAVCCALALEDKVTTQITRKAPHGTIAPDIALPTEGLSAQFTAIAVVICPWVAGVT
ncbi:hypothetical protein GGQ71_003349 [Rhizobium taibaishanense]|uniref:Uncharacterized protein n=1 Tax=Allorhizobium taibaishanense TaxID=887144 RepID=A0A7W6HPN6_9HYPH|nr:hypothetical protein [Allorhizobium taibaishanense]MBB4009067.1 hypothetical protein [Allorhizobium taibaishanense]